MKARPLAALLATTLLNAATPAQRTPDATLPVLPGACGFGVRGPIARGKPVLRVTTTDARGEGSLQAAVQAAAEHGGGVIVFETSGVIDVEEELPGSRLRIGASNLWIAGQTAPAPGIFVRGGLLITGRDLVLQHLGVYRPAQDQRQCDTVTLQGSHHEGPTRRAILDHVALWGANDGNLDIALYGDSAVTVQHSILACPLRGGHPKAAAHNFNSLIYGSRAGPARITWRLNLFSTALDRQPLSSFDALVMVNNVFYNRQPRVGRYIYLRNAYQNGADSRNSIVGNVFFDTSREFARLPILLRPPGEGDGSFLRTSRIHLAGNAWNLSDPPVPDDPWDELVWDSGNPRDPILAAEPPVWNEGLEPLPWDQVLDAVRAGVGPRPADRVPFLERLADEAGREPTHGIPTKLAEIGGELRGLLERHRDSDPPDAPHELSDDGYTHLEHWLFAHARAVESD